MTPREAQAQVPEIMSVSTAETRKPKDAQAGLLGGDFGDVLSLSPQTRPSEGVAECVGVSLETH